MKFRKKPVVIEAVQITDATFDAPHPNPDHIPGVLYDPVNRTALIQTLEGDMIGQLGDWIIRGVKGELYPCKPDIFEATYAPADEPANALEIGAYKISPWPGPEGGFWIEHESGEGMQTGQRLIDAIHKFYQENF